MSEYHPEWEMDYKPNKNFMSLPPSLTGETKRSVLTTDVAVNFKEKGQLNPIFEYLMSKEYEFEVSVEQGQAETIYTLTIHNISWADNVIELFTKLKELDFNE